MNSLYILFSSVLLSLGLPNETEIFGNGVIILFALVPYFYVLSKSKTIRQAIKYSVLFALFHSLFTFFWFMFYKEFSVWTVSGVALGHMMYFVFFGPFLYLLLKNTTILRPLLIALCWTLYEYIKSIGFIGFPWGLLSQGWGDVLPLIQISDITGIWGPSFLIAFINAVFFEFYLIIINAGSLRQLLHSVQKSRNFKYQTFTATALLLLTLAYGVYSLQKPVGPVKTFTISLIQPNTDNWKPEIFWESMAETQELSIQSMEQNDVDLLVWPENSLRSATLHPAYRRAFQYMPRSYPFDNFLEDLEIPFIVGAPVIVNADVFEAMNGAMLVVDGEVIETYGKQHPVPFAEHIPFYEYEWVKKIFREVFNIGGVWLKGNRNTIFTLTSAEGETLNFGVPICFEDSMPYIGSDFKLDGAELLVNIANVAWSRTSSAQSQHFITARFRSIESRIPLVRAGNGGLTSYVDTKGRLISSLPMYTPEYLVVQVDIPRNSELTFYNRFGDWMIFVTAILLGTMLYLDNKKDKKKLPA
jgi:apolipoprotein N-acyltransferase